MRAGLIGLGMMGRNHARVLRTLDGVTLVGVADPMGDTTGSLMGVAMGLGWAKSFLHQEETAPETT